MQQTEKYQFNLIETSDTFSPDPLNENMEKLEAALDAVTAHADAGDAALDARLRVFEAKHFVIEGYTGDGTANREFMLGFDPQMAIIVFTGGGHNVALPGNPVAQSGKKLMEIIPGGLRMNGYNISGTSYHYIAIG